MPRGLESATHTSRRCAPPHAGAGALPTADEKLARLLQVADENIGAALKKYELDQELGETINELSEIYFSKYPRSFDAPWPSPDHLQHDMQLRALFEGLKARSTGTTVAEFQKMAEPIMKDIGGEGFANDQTGFSIGGLFRAKRRGEMNNQVGTG